MAVDQTEAQRLTGLVSFTVPTETGLVGADVLWQRFWLSPYGECMDEQPYRFTHQFGYDRAQMVRDLGVDVLPRDHQLLTAEFIAYILDAEKETKGSYPIAVQQIGTLLLAGAIHDSGETMHPAILEEVGAVVGDIEFGQKTDEDRRIEAAVRASLYRRLYADVAPNAIAQVEAIIAHTDTTEMHHIYEAAHDVQTFNTALLAQQSWLRDYVCLQEGGQPAPDAASMDKKAQLFSQVFERMIPRLHALKDRYSFISHYVYERREVIQQFDAIYTPSDDV